MAEGNSSLFDNGLPANKSKGKGRYPKWIKIDPAQKDAIAKEYLDGAEVPALAKKHGISRTEIYRILGKRNITVRPRPPRLLCKKCNKNPRYKNTSLCIECRRPVNAAKMKSRRAKHVADGVCRDCGAALDPTSKAHHCEPCLVRHRRTTKSNKLRRKVECFNAYGGCRCECCGEMILEFLTIDHIDDSGADHRRAINVQGGHRFYGWLKKNGYPSGYQVLCFNCQWGKRLGAGGVCPHKNKIGQAECDLPDFQI